MCCFSGVSAEVINLDDGYDIFYKYLACIENKEGDKMKHKKKNEYFAKEFIQYSLNKKQRKPKPYDIKRTDQAFNKLFKEACGYDFNNRK